MIPTLNEDPFGFESNLAGGIETGLGLGLGAEGAEAGQEAILLECFHQSQSQSHAFTLPKWVLEESSTTSNNSQSCPRSSSYSYSSSSSSSSSKTGEKRSRSNSITSDYSLSNYSDHSIDSLPSLSDSQNSLESEDEEERMRIKAGWIGGSLSVGNLNKKSSGNADSQAHIHRVSVGSESSGRVEGSSHVKKKRCSRELGGKSSSDCFDGQTSSNHSPNSPPDPDETITVPICQSQTSLETESTKEASTQMSHGGIEKSKPEPQSFPSIVFQDSNSTSTIPPSRSHFVDKLVDSAVSTLEEIWSVRTDEMDCSMPNPPTTSTYSTSTSSQSDSQRNVASSPTSNGTTSSPLSSIGSFNGRSTGSLSVSSSPASSVDSNSDSGSIPRSSLQTSHSILKPTSKLPSPSSQSSNSNSNQLPLRFFVRETLRRSKTSCSVLQTALIYCLRAKKTIQDSISYSEKQISQSKKEEPLNFHSSLCCKRRTFLAALIISSKFLQDRTYSNKAWCKISGLDVKELGEMERSLLKVLDWNLFVRDGEWENWCRERERKLGSAIVGKVEPSQGDSVKTRIRNIHRSISENVQGMQMHFDSEVSTTSHNNFALDPEIPRDSSHQGRTRDSNFSMQESPSIYLEENNSQTPTPFNEPPSHSICRSSTLSLSLPRADSSNASRPKARLPSRVRSQVHPLQTSTIVSNDSVGLDTEGVDPFAFSMSSL